MQQQTTTNTNTISSEGGEHHGILEGIQVYKQAVELVNPTSWDEPARSPAEKEAFQQCIDHFDALDTRTMSPRDHAYVLYYQASSFVSLKNMTAAKLKFRRCLELFPTHVMAPLSLGNILYTEMGILYISQFETASPTLIPAATYRPLVAEMQELGKKAIQAGVSVDASHAFMRSANIWDTIWRMENKSKSLTSLQLLRHEIPDTTSSSDDANCDDISSDDDEEDKSLLQFDKTTVDCTTCVLFYGHKGGLETACLSNWYPAQFDAPSHACVTEKEAGERPIRRFYTAEQYMMYNKALFFKDYDIAEQVLCVPNGNPKECKQLGRSVKGFAEDGWNSMAVDIVTEGVFQKFDQNPAMGKALLDTGDAPIAEASKHDTIWGIGLAADVARITPATEWPGTNYLGECLMRARAMLRAKVGKDVCVVCHGTAETLPKFPCCNQTYHSQCMKTMLAYNHRDCPACRARFPCGFQCVYDELVPYTLEEYECDVQKTHLELRECCESHAPSTTRRRRNYIIREEHLALNWTEMYRSTPTTGLQTSRGRAWFRLACTLDFLATHLASADDVEFMEHTIVPFPLLCQDWARSSPAEYQGFKCKMVAVFDTLIDRILNGTNGTPQHMLHGVVATCVADEVVLAMAWRHDQLNGFTDTDDAIDDMWKALNPAFHAFYHSLPPFDDEDDYSWDVSEILREDYDTDDMYGKWSVIFNAPHCQQSQRAPMKTPKEWFDRFDGVPLKRF
jgi:ribA/ribD-fused uncharacterized protein